MQATVFRFDRATRSGSVITDAGLVLPFDEEALAVSGLRHLRPGQRLSVERDDGDGGRITRLALGSISSA